MRLFFEPGSVVLIGVTRRMGTGSYNNVQMMLRYGYGGRVFVVHPKVKEIAGVEAFPDVEALPQVPDLAVISLGRDRVLPAFTKCLRKGIKRFVVISQGFADADEEGKRLQVELARLAEDASARVVGPNTMGVVNPFNGFSTAFVDILKDPCPPPLSMIVQSGVFQVGYECFTEGMGKAIDIGNGCDVDFVDVMEYLEQDPQTKVIVLHMEGVKRGRKFLQVASRIARSKPIVVLKTGRSVAGARAALSHTGSLVGEDAVLDAAFARGGILRVRNMLEMKAACRALLNFTPPVGPRLGVITATGACGIITADACEDYGLELAPFPETVRASLENPRIPWHRLHNPLDIWPLGMVTGSFVEVFTKGVAGLMSDPKVDAILGIAPVLPSPLHADLDMVGAVRELGSPRGIPKPLALWLYGGDQARQCALLAGVPNVACFSSIDEALLGLSALWRCETLRRSLEKTPDFPASPSVRLAPRFTTVESGVVAGNEAWRLLRDYGIPAAPGGVAGSLAHALEISKKTGYPVVLKIVSPQWVHKSDLGGIRLNVFSPVQLETAFAELLALFQRATPDGQLEGILVQKQMQGTELILGIKRDPQFGPVLLAGMGGIYTEVLKDVARSLLPLPAKEEALSLLRGLRGYPILEGIRGGVPADLSGLAQAMLCLSQLALEHPEINELDLNPVIVSPEGCWCVDCRIVLS